MKKTKRFRGGGISGDLGSLALIGGLGYMFGRGSKSKEAKEKAAKDAVVENLKPKEEPKKEFTDAERKQAEDYMVGGDQPGHNLGTKTPSDTTTSPKKDSSKVKNKPPKAKRVASAGITNASKSSPPTDNSSISSFPGGNKPTISSAVSDAQGSSKAPSTTAAPKKVEAKSEQARKVTPANKLVGEPYVASKPVVPGGGRNTFLTKERTEKAKASMAKARSGMFKSNKEKLEEYQENNKKYQKMLDGLKGKKAGGTVKKYAAGGTVSASRRADGIAQRGKTRGRVC